MFVISRNAEYEHSAHGWAGETSKAFLQTGAMGFVRYGAQGRDFMRRLKRARIESINASWEIANVRAERSRSSSMLFGLSRAGNTILRVNTIQEVGELLPRPYRDAVIHPESCCGEILAGPGVFDVSRYIFGRCCKSLTFYVNIQLLVLRSFGMY